MRFTETVEPTAELTIAAFRFVERCAYWNLWLDILDDVAIACHGTFPVLESSILMRLGQAQFQQGLTSQSLKTLHKAEMLVSTIQDEKLLLQFMFRLGTSYLGIIKYQKAETHMQHVLASVDAEKSPIFWIAAKNVCAIIALEKGAFLQAGNLFGEVASFAKRNKLRTQQILVLANWSNALIKQGQFEEAEKKIVDAFALILSTDGEYYSNFLRLCEVRLFYGRGEWQDARIVLETISVPNLVHNRQDNLLAEVEYIRAQILLKQDKLENAEKSVNVAKRIWRDCGKRSRYARSVGLWSQIKYKQENPMATRYIYQSLDLLAPYMEIYESREMVAELDKLVNC